MKEKSFCNGKLCRESDRKHICVKSKLKVCGGCSVKTKIGTMTIDKYIEYMFEEGNKELEKAKKEIIEMLKLKK